MTTTPSGPGLVSRTLRVAGGAWMITGLGAPLGVVAALVLLGKLDGGAALQSRTVEVWALAIAVALLARMTASAIERRWCAVFLSAAVLLAAGHLAGVKYRRFDATYDLGEAEPGVVPRIAAAGGAVTPPRILAPAIPATRAEAAVLLVDGRRVEASIGRDVELGAGLVLELLDVVAAPAFKVVRASGAVEGEGIVKFVPGERDYFQVALLPHRFYVTLPFPERAAPVALPKRFALEVFRGKIRVFRDDALALGSPVTVEGVTVTFAEGGRWARVRVHGEVGTGFLWAAAALLVAATAAMASSGRRGRR